MYSRRSSISSDASTARTSETFTAFEASLQAKLDLWMIDSEDESSLQSLIERNPGAKGSRYPSDRPFKLRDQHCGIWEDAPNKECHASFGDQGTTASVSCYGNLIQMSRFLGVGNSGVFSIDHKSTHKPYHIASRADGLNDLAKECPGGGNSSFGLELPKKFLPDQVPTIKWVNWRWPRYEWKVQDDCINARVSLQWLVENNTLLQQVVVTNTGTHSIEDFEARISQHMLIRDLDYLQESSTKSIFDDEDDREVYIRGPGPHGFSWITASILHNRRSVMSHENDHTGYTSDSEHIGEVKQSSGKQHQHDTEEHTNVEQSRGQPPNEPYPPNDESMWKKRRISDTWSAKNVHAVVSVMSLFVNGEAVQMGMEPPRIQKNIEAAGRSSSELEITVAYRMIAVPKGKLDWKDFLIPAEAADVDAMLAAGTEELWGHLMTEDCKCSPSLCDLGLSMADSRVSMRVNQDGCSPGLNSQNADNASHDAQKSTIVHDNTNTNANAQLYSNTEETSPTTESFDQPRAAQNMSAAPVNRAATGRSQKISPMKQIEYLTWRHTEHVLSVCTIPLAVPHLSHRKRRSEATLLTPGGVTSNLGTSTGEKLEFEVPLALTCGDMSGHRVCTSASFFAFKFLVDVLQRLPLVKQTPYVVSLQRRIHKVCREHIRWLEWVRKPWLTLSRTKSLLHSGCFAANYWVDGQIMRSGSASWQPDDAVTDTAYQILKVTSYVKCLKARQNFEDHGQRHHMALLRDVWTCWIHELDDRDKRNACAWHHKTEDALNTYRLDDHVWLWSSLSELHDLGLWDLTDPSNIDWKYSAGRWISNIHSLSSMADTGASSSKTTSLKNSAVFSGFSSMARRLIPKKVQRAVLQRFTVENRNSQERMLAVTRSSRETRFLFHSRDTALFYGHKEGFFRANTSFNELWERTVRSQIHHDKALLEKRDSPLWFGLGVLAGLNGHSIDERSPAELTKRSVEDLIQVSAHNAFIPGKFDIETRRPSIFSDEQHRDYYYHVGFEACHILLVYAKNVDVAYRSEKTSYSATAFTKQFEGNSHQLEALINEAFMDENLDQNMKQNMGSHQYGSDNTAVTGLFGADGRLDRLRSLIDRKRSRPFNNMNDSSRVTVLEEEWLYNYPGFLLVKDTNLQDQLRRFSNLSKPVYGSLSSIIDKALESVKENRRGEFVFSTTTALELSDGLVADLPGQKGPSRRQKRGNQNTGASLVFLTGLVNEKLWNSIGKKRTAIKAKKRFICLPVRSNSQTALLCWLASTEVEKPAMSLFFDRHVEYENLVWDETNEVLNIWQTELHMSFWMIYYKSQPLHQGLPHPIRAPWPRSSQKELRRASLGYRFDGDFFDRYWTCHFIQYVPGLTMRRDSVPSEWIDMLVIDKRSWQRKVLELHFLQYMLNLILTSSNKILKEIEKELGLEKGTLIFFSLTPEAYSLSQDLWPIYEEFLQKAEEDVTASLKTLSKWTIREVERVEERLRWTRKDEKKYRAHINILRNQIERQRWDLENCRDRMCKLRETLGTRHEKIRANLDSKREQNIQYFTNVTMIFLPLGFASSFFSMNGAPSNDLIISLAKLAAASFAVTVILILSASILMEKAKIVANVVILQPLKQHSLSIRKHSLLVKGTSSEHELYGTNTMPQTYSTKDWMVSPWFWPAYLFLELPTRAISSALTAPRTGDLSVSAFWRVALGIAILPTYAISRVVLMVLVNAVLVLKITRSLYRLCTKQFPEEDRISVNEMSANETAGERVHRRRPSFVGVSEESGDAENNSAGNRAFFDHFKELMPTAEPVHSLRSFERKLNQRIERFRRRERMRARQEALDM